MCEILVKINEKMDLISSLLKEIENGRAEIKNMVQPPEFSPYKEECLQLYFDLTSFLLIPDNIERQKFLKDKIDIELRQQCHHQWIEDDIEYGLEMNKHVVYCIKCNISNS